MILRHQLNILRRSATRRPRLTSVDRLLFVWLYRPWPGVLRSLTLLRPETVVRWHRAGFRAYWRWRSQGRAGRPTIGEDVRDLIHEISLANPLWGAPRIHGELLKLGIEVAQSTVSKYMAKGRRPPSQSWWTFLRNHADGIASVDLFVVPTITFIRVRRASPSAPADRFVRRHGTSDRRVARPADLRSVSVGHCAALSRPRSRQVLR